MVGNRQGPPGEFLGGLVLGGQDGLFGRLADNVAVQVLVDDGLTDDEDLERLGFLEVLQNIVHGVAPRKIGEVLADTFRKDRQIPVDEAGRAEHDIPGEGNPAPDRFYRRLLFNNLARVVLLGILVVGPLGVDIGFHEFNRLHRRRPVIDGHVVDAVQRGNGLGAQVMGKSGVVRSLIDVFVRRHRDDEDIAQSLRLLKVADVPDVQQVEDAVALYNLSFTGAQRGCNPGQLF